MSTVLSVLKQIWATIKKYWWLVLSAIVGIVVWVLTSSDDQNEDSEKSRLKKSHKKAVSKYKQSEAEAKVEKAKRKAKTESKKRELEDISKEEDPYKKSERLSDFLNREL